MTTIDLVMKALQKIVKILLIVFLSFVCDSAMSQENYKQDSIRIREIYSEVLSNGECYDNLRVLCKDIGARLSGSPEAAKAVQWGKKLLEDYGFENVHLQDVTVPKWTRGDLEYAYYYSKGEKYPVNICALGGSVGCEKDIVAKVVEVKNFEQLEELGKEKIEGKIVLFNRAMDPVLINTGAAYGGAVNQRSRGASEAAKYGASGVLIRSMTHALDTFPHTGAMYYMENITPIPAAAISTVHAYQLSQDLKKDPELQVTMNLGCVKYPDVVQANVIGEIRGSEFPDEYIVVGGHLDSWDIGEGAHDDGAGIVQSIEVLRIFQSLDLPLKRTLRVVLFINEENGNDGGETYAEYVRENNIKHLAAIESDAGGLVPRGFRIEGPDDKYEMFRTWEELFEPYNIHVFRRGYSGVDIRPLKNDSISLFGLAPDSQRYFDYHHSARDVFENVNQRELELGAGTVSALVYLVDKYFVME